MKSQELVTLVTVWGVHMICAFWLFYIMWIFLWSAFKFHHSVFLCGDIFCVMRNAHFLFCYLRKESSNIHIYTHPNICMHNLIVARIVLFNAKYRRHKLSGFLLLFYCPLSTLVYCVLNTAYKRFDAIPHKFTSVFV